MFTTKKSYILHSHAYPFQHKLSFKDNDGKDVTEDIEADMTENIAYMKVDRGEHGVHHIVHDYNRVWYCCSVNSMGNCGIVNAV